MKPWIYSFEAKECFNWSISILEYRYTNWQLHWHDFPITTPEELFDSNECWEMEVNWFNYILIKHLPELFRETD